MFKIIAVFSKRLGLFLFSFFLSLQLYSQVAFTVMRDSMAGLELAKEMAPGVNLWNTLDAHGNWMSGLETETMWGHPYTTQEITDFIAERGFKTLRVPVTWYNHMGPAPDYKIDDEWMDRVEEVVMFSLNSNLYTILNIHHDDLKENEKGSWLIPTYEKEDQNKDQLTKVWTQIATRFKDYSDYLLFETMNEPREVGHANEWSGGNEEHREVINAYNKAAVDAIRATGGNNSNRFIMIPQVGANVASALGNMVIPNNDEKIIISVHRYHPYNFCLNDDGTDKWGTAAEYTDLESSIKELNEKFVSKGQAVILGEWGAKSKDNYAERINYYKAYTDICKKWDVTNLCWMYSLDRHKLTWTEPLIEEAILQAYNANMVHVKDITIEKPQDTIYAGETLQLSATILPDSATYQEVIWTSYNKNIASVNENGLVTAQARGVAIMSAATIGYQKSFKVIVVDTSMHTNFVVEAETFEKQNGIQAEACSDEGGGENIGYIENNDWSSYSISIDTTGVYNLTFRAATDTDGGRIEVKVDNKSVGSVNIEGSKSTGWQDYYTTEPIEIELEEGVHDIKLIYTGNGYLFNLNWFAFDFLGEKDDTSFDQLNSNFDFQLYPNPAADQLTIDCELANYSISILSIHGKQHFSAENICGPYTIDISNINKGIKFIVLKHKNGTEVKRVVIL